MDQEERLFKDISYLELGLDLCSAEQNHLCDIGSMHHENNSVNLFEFGSVIQEGNAVKRDFLSRALAALLFSGTKLFV